MTNKKIKKEKRTNDNKQLDIYKLFLNKKLNNEFLLQITREDKPLDDIRLKNYYENVKELLSIYQLNNYDKEKMYLIFYEKYKHLGIDNILEKIKPFTLDYLGVVVESFKEYYDIFISNLNELNLKHKEVKTIEDIDLMLNDNCIVYYNLCITLNYTFIIFHYNTYCKKALLSFEDINNILCQVQLSYFENNEKCLVYLPLNICKTTLQKLFLKNDKYNLEDITECSICLNTINNFENNKCFNTICKCGNMVCIECVKKINKCPICEICY